VDRAAESAERVRPLWRGYPNRRARVMGTIFTSVWLLYIVASIPSLFSSRYSVLYTVGGVAILVAFCAIYLVFVPNWPVPNRYAPHGLAALAALTVIGCVFYGAVGLVGLWTFVASASGLLVKNRRWAVRAVLACIACFVLFSVTTHSGSSNFFNSLLPMVFIGFGMIGLRHLVQTMGELASAREEVAQLAANSERLRLARDMHDLTGQSLSMITLKSELAARLLGRLPDSPDRDRARDEVEQVAAVSRQTLRDIREAISGYRRPTLAVEIITARAALSSAGIAVHDDTALTLLSGTFDPDAEAALAWSLREAVTNVVRHSGAKNCHISLSSRPESMILTVRDDGAGHPAPGGCDSGPVPAGPVPHRSSTSIGSGSGLHGIAERLSAVGGSLKIRPDTAPGFCLVAAVPTGQQAVYSENIVAQSETVNDIVNS
jgi:two-component system, NarL family, sensor histidine kinase DesK